jgi:hypothetical protein
MNKIARSVGLLAGRRLVWMVAVVLSAPLAGCGDSDTVDAARTMTFYPVKGKVLLPDGKPLASAKITFVGPVTTSSPTESDGTFTVKGTKDGLPAGDYKVRLGPPEATGGGKKAAMPFPSNYTDEDGSGLTATVKSEGPNDFQFELKKGSAAAAGSAGPARSHK